MSSLRSKNEGGRAAIWLLGFLVTGCLLIGLFPKYGLAYIPAILTVDEPAPHADAIVVLLGGDGPRRIIKAYELYRERKAPVIVFGSGFLDTEALKFAPQGFVWLPSSAHYEAALISLKVPKNDYLVVDTKRDFDTAQELASITSFLRTRGAKSAILVTSRSHSRRVDLIWDRVAPEIGHATVAAPAPELDEWWTSNRATHAVVYEIAGLVKESFRQLTQLAGLH